MKYCNVLYLNLNKESLAFLPLVKLESWISETLKNQVRLPQFANESVKAQESQETWPSTYRHGVHADITTDVKHSEDFHTS